MEEIIEIEVTENDAAPTAEFNWETATAEDHLSAAESNLAEIGSLCALSLAAYTNPNHEPSYAQIVARCDLLAQKYNWHSKAAAWLTCAESENPMLKAVQLLEYDIVSIKTKKLKVSDNSYIEFLACNMAKRRLSLTDVYGFCKNKKVECGTLDWYRTLEKLCCVLTLEHARLLGIPDDKIASIDASFLMSKVAREVQLAAEDPDSPNPLSKTQITKNLTTVLQQLIGNAYHADSRDAAFLRMVFAGQGRASLSVKSANTKRLSDLLIQIAHRAVCDKSYTIIAPTKKERA